MPSKKPVAQHQDVRNDGQVAREALRYALKHRGVTMVLASLCREPIGQINMGSIAQDLALLAEFNIKVVLVDSRNDSAWVRSGLAGKYTHVQVGSDEEIVKAACDHNAAKICLLCDGDGIKLGNGPVNNIDVNAAKEALAVGTVHGEAREFLRLAVRSCENGIRRVHFINGGRASSLFEELFTEHGSGTLVYDEETFYKEVRKANANDILSIARILAKANPAITLAYVEEQVKDFRVLTIDSDIVGCMRISYEQKNGAVVHSIGCSTSFKASEVYEGLLHDAFIQIRREHGRKMVVPITELPDLVGTESWFKKLGLLMEGESPENKGLPAWSRYIG